MADCCRRRWARGAPCRSAVKCRFHTTIPNEATHVRVLNRYGMRTRAFGSVVMAALCCCAVFRGVGAAGGDVPRQAPWLAVTTANFEMTGPSTEADLRRVGEQLERFRDALGQVLPRTTLAAARRPRV